MWAQGCGELRAENTRMLTRSARVHTHGVRCVAVRTPARRVGHRRRIQLHAVRRIPFRSIGERRVANAIIHEGPKLSEKEIGPTYRSLSGTRLYRTVKRVRERK